MSEKIFVSVAAYKDPELASTLGDAVAKASSRERLAFGVCNQNSKFDELSNFGDRVINIPYGKSKGACWARSKIQEELFSGEDYYFQIDSHHRFVQGWDDLLIDLISECKSPKSILTTYLPAYTIGKEETSFAKARPWGMAADRFCSNGPILLFKPANIPHDKGRVLPIRFLSGHFLFARGSFVQDVPYDPQLYFSGEEITLAMRAYTHGYDLYCPNEVVALHEYTRQRRTKHWDDHVASDGNEKPWHVLDKESKKRCEMLLTHDEEKVKKEFGKYGIGNARSRRFYERYAAIDFATKRIHKDAKAYAFANRVRDIDEWLETMTVFRSRAIANLGDLFQANDLEFCFVGFEDEDGALLHRQDILEAELPQYADLSLIELSASVESVKPPRQCVLWPYSKGQQWLRKVVLDVEVDSV